MKHLKTFESYEMDSMSREEMCKFLMSHGYEMHELEECPMEELESMCRMCQEEGSMPMQEKKKWIQDTKMKKGALHKQLGYDEDEKIPAGILKKIADGEVGSKVKVKGEEHTITALMKKRANLAKTLKGLK